MSLEVIPATIVEVIKFNRSLRAIRLVPDEGRLANYCSGDYLFVRVPTVGEDSVSSIRSLTQEPQVRAYSLSSSPTQNFYEIVVVEKPVDPHVSKLLQYIDRGGQKLEVSTPKWVYHGKLSLTGPRWQEQKLVFIGGGAGIAPFVSATRYIAALNLTTNVWLLGSFRGPEHLIFHEELLEILRKYPNIKYYPTLTREVPVGWPWGKGRFTSDKFREIIQDLAERTALICAGCEMIVDLKRALVAGGVPDSKQRIKTECWG